MAETIFGQIVVGPPGSGKSTYCRYICSSLKQLGRNVKIINLDPANDCLPYKPAIDVMELINVDTVMEQAKCGPNGAMIHCIEQLNENYGWLYDKMVTLIQTEINNYMEAERKRKEEKAGDDTDDNESGQGVDLTKNKPYLLFDCPGQSELYVHNTAMREIIQKLMKPKKHFDLRLVCMNLCDAYHASDLGKYISLVMNSLSTMLNLELPHVNVLSKVDKLESYGKTRFSLDYYCQVLDLKYLLETELDSPFFEKYRKLSEGLVDIIQDYSLVSFTPLNIQQAEDIKNVLSLADRAIGYYINDLDLSILQMNPQLIEMASGRRLKPLDDATI